MAMSKRDFIALADVMRPLLGQAGPNISRGAVVEALCFFMRNQNPRFMEQRWKDYLYGDCGPNGGKR